MTPQKQLLRHDPDNGVYGDCFRTTLACLLDLAPAEVPHFMDGAVSDATGVDAANAWLAKRRMMLICFPFDCGLDLLFATMAKLNPGVHYLLTGESRSGVNHCVVCRDDRIVWDPSLTDAGIVGPTSEGHYWINVLAVLQ